MTQLSPTSRIFFFSMVPPSLKRRSSLLTARGRPPWRHRRAAARRSNKNLPSRSRRPRHRPPPTPRRLYAHRQRFQAVQRSCRAESGRPQEAQPGRHHWRTTPPAPSSMGRCHALRQLLNHTNGLPDYTESLAFSKNSRRTPPPLRLPPPSRLRRRRPAEIPPSRAIGDRGSADCVWFRISNSKENHFRSTRARSCANQGNNKFGQAPSSGSFGASRSPRGFFFNPIAAAPRNLGYKCLSEILSASPLPRRLLHN